MNDLGIALQAKQWLRAADANEVVETWRYVLALKRDPAALVLSCQALPTLDRSVMAPASFVERGAYVLNDVENGQPDILLLATGSEVYFALAARQELVAQGIGARVVSMPGWELFERQPREYRDAVLLPRVAGRVAVEQASSFGWDRYVGNRSAVVGMHTFGRRRRSRSFQRNSASLLTASFTWRGTLSLR